MRQILAPWLPPRPLRVLELGSGRGVAAYAFACDGHEVTAIEPAPSRCVGWGALRDLVRRSGIQIRIIAAKGEATPVRDGLWDLVYMRQVLHHAVDLVQMLRQVYRVLRPGGWVLATREHVLTRREDLPAFLGGHPTHAYLRNENAYTLGEYVGAFRRAGFRLTKTWAPIETIVNFYPGTEAERSDLASQIPKLTWRGIGRILAGVPGFRTYALRRSIRRDRTPGRLYSFLAVRPSLGA